MRSAAELAGASEMIARADARDPSPTAQLFGLHAAAAFLSYLVLSVLFFGRGVFAHPATVYIGRGPDPQQHIWFLAWWAHAVSHHLNPFLTSTVWAPSGVNLAWATDFPLAACLLYPITRLWGPIVACNVLHLAAPPLAGWSAFVLCRYLAHRFWPAWLGGCLFAFSPYMLTGMIGGVLLMLVFPLPLAVWATLRRIEDELTARGFVAILVLLLVAQFLMSAETFASAALFGAIAIALAARMAPAEEQGRLLSMGAWATLRRLAGEIGARRLVTILVALLVAQFLMSPEIFASAALFGGIAIALAARMAPAEEQGRLLSVGAWIILAYAVSAVILLPYLYYMFAFGRPRGLIFPPWQMCIDLVNFFVPTSLNQLGNLPLFGAIAHQFLATLADSGGYMGLPLLAIVALFARERWRERRGRFMAYMLASACVLAMGPLLEILGHRIMPLPAAVLMAVPLLDKSLPARFMLYTYLALAVIVAMWLAEEREQKERKTLRWALSLAIVPFMLPNLSASFWATPAKVPAFFSSGLYRQYIAPGETVMVLPYGYHGEGMLWQAAADMYFRMVGGYVGFAPLVPEEHIRWPIMAGLYNDAGVPEAGDQLKAYLANHDVGVIILGPRTQYLVSQVGSQRTSATWRRSPTIDRERIATRKLLASLDTQPLEVGGITLYRIAPQTLAPYRKLTALAMERRTTRARFEALLLGAQRYLAKGGDPASLSPERAQQLGLLPQDWFGGPLFSAVDPFFHCRVVLGPSNPAGIAVGVEGWYDALEPVIRSYGADASRIYFPYPVPLSPASAPRGPAMMVMTFDRAGLEHAVAAAMRRDTADLHAGAPARAAGR